MLETLTSGFFLNLRPAISLSGFIWVPGVDPRAGYFVALGIELRGGVWKGVRNLKVKIITLRYILQGSRADENSISGIYCHQSTHANTV